jgi:hypothetical protein
VGPKNYLLFRTVKVITSLADVTLRLKVTVTYMSMQKFASSPYVKHIFNQTPGIVILPLTTQGQESATNK